MGKTAGVDVALLPPRRPVDALRCPVEQRLGVRGVLVLGGEAGVLRRQQRATIGERHRAPERRGVSGRPTSPSLRL